VERVERLPRCDFFPALAGTDLAFQSMVFT